jgi:hypothetical protein
MQASPSSFRLPANTAKDVVVDVAVPSDAPIGGNYAAAIVEAKPLGGGGGLKITTSLSTIVLLTVEGSLIHDLDVSIAGVHRLTACEPLGWTVTARNNGNVHEVLSLDPRAKGLFGTAELNDIKLAVVLPGAERTFDVSGSVRSAPDLFLPEVRWVALGADGVAGTGDDERGSADGSRTFYAPLWSLILGAILVLLLVGAGVRARRGSAIGSDEDFDDGDDLDEH